MTAARIALLALALLPGCSAFTFPATIKSLGDDGHWAQYSAERRGALILRSPDGHLIACSEPAPDVTIDSVTRLLASVSVPQVQASGTGEVDVRSKAVELAGRSQVILFLREALFRLCEQYGNGAMTAQDIRDLYPQVISASVEFARAQQLQAAADQSKSSATQAVAETRKVEAQKDLASEIKQLPAQAQETLKDLSTGAPP